MIIEKLSRCALTYNGKLMDKIVDDFMITNVEGRGLFTPKNEYVSINGIDGDVLKNSSYPSRDIKVQFYLYAKNNEEWLEKMKIITMALQSKDDVEFSFKDELGIRFGRLSGFDDPDYDSNSAIGYFTIHCSDPFLYSDVIEVNNRINNLRYDYYPVKIESIVFKANESSDKIRIYNPNSGEKIIVNKSVNSGDRISYDGQNIWINSQNVLRYLDYVSSDYFEFELYSEDKVLANVSDDIKIKYRYKLL
ncbi:distal tail protein Dit [Anaerococcus tetradius]|uniref:Putative phage tail component domain protein n=1 Tax=Anaerococcus tetradius ATCC 35098 TaxID=525255 RepID=C2CHN8_9FIRM|nr:distal tail protein Dit [Anaerococcus tetradius]EEI82894.1 putative phage tail component domain protein [Anaerococcus tetradius ATCC 35098]